MIRLSAAIAVVLLTTAALLIGQAADTSEPAVAIASPAEDAGVSGVVTIRAATGDNVGVVGVQFQVDLVDFGAEDTAPPFEAPWNTDLSGSGAHVLGAIARDAAGNVATSELVTVVVCGLNVQPCPAGGVPPQPANRPPVAIGDSLTSTGGAPVTFTAALLLANDSDPDNQPLTVSTVQATSTRGGTIANDGGGSWTYAPSAGLAGEDTFLYTISDGVDTASAVVTVTVTPLQPAPLGLVAQFNFDESDPVVVTDLSPAGNNGTITGAVRAAGIRGNALQFDGVDDWVTVNDSASLDLTTGMTLEAWVKPSALAGWNTVVLKETGGGLAYSLYANDDAPRAAGYCRIGWIDESVAGAAGLTLDVWTHLAVTYDSGSMQLYINGELAATHAITGAIATSDEPLRIGGNAVWGEFFTGLIDEVRIYDRALTQAEVNADMNQTTTPVDTTSPPVNNPPAEENNPPAVFNNPPAAANDSFSTTGLPITFTTAVLLANDSDPDGDAINVMSVAATSAGGGTVADHANGTWTYTPRAGFSGADTFGYTITDARGATATAMVTVTVSAPPPPVDADLVLALDFNEGIGLTAFDRSGVANHGALRVDGPLWTAAGKYGGALYFDGVNDWVTVADTASLDLTAVLTIEAWVNPVARPVNWTTVVQKEGTVGLAYSLYAFDGGTLQGGSVMPAGYVRIEGADRVARGVSELVPNTWTHLAMTYGGGSIRFYVNGALVASEAVSGSVEVSGQPLRIGGNALWGEFFKGLIDEVRVYKRVLTQMEIQADMSTPLP
jgi:hypothetical protein